MGKVSILGFKKAQVFCIKNSSCVKTGKSLRAIATIKKASITPMSGSNLSVKTGKSLRAIATCHAGDSIAGGECSCGKFQV